MGPNDNAPVTYYALDNGKWVELTLGDLPDVTFCDERNESEYALSNTKDSFTCTFRMNQTKCSRKKFVKQLMGAGFPRDYANAFARATRRWKIPYREALNEFEMTGHLPM